MRWLVGLPARLLCIGVRVRGAAGDEALAGAERGKHTLDFRAALFVRRKREREAEQPLRVGNGARVQCMERGGACMHERLRRLTRDGVEMCELTMCAVRTRRQSRTGGQLVLE